MEAGDGRAGAEMEDQERRASAVGCTCFFEYLITTPASRSASFHTAVRTFD